MAHKVNLGLGAARLIILKMALDISSGDFYWVDGTAEETENSFCVVLKHKSTDSTAAIEYLPEFDGLAGYLNIRFSDTAHPEFIQRVLTWLFNMPKIGRNIHHALRVDLDQPDLYLCRNYAELYAVLYQQELTDWVGSPRYPFIAIASRHEKTLRSLPLDPILELIKK